MRLRGTLESAVLGGSPTLILRTDNGMSYELVSAPGTATSLVGRAVTVHGELLPEQFGFAMTGPRVRVTGIEPG